MDTTRFPHGVDKGYCSRYSQLSYRRKFVSDFWATVIGVPLIAFTEIEFYAKSDILWLVFFTFMGPISMMSNFRKWKSLEQKAPTDGIWKPTQRE